MIEVDCYPLIPIKLQCLKNRTIKKSWYGMCHLNCLKDIKKEKKNMEMRFKEMTRKDISIKQTHYKNNNNFKGTKSVVHYKVYDLNLYAYTH